MNFFSRNYKKSWDLLKRSRNYIIFAIVLFSVSVLFGFLFPILFREEIFSFLSQLSSRIADYNLGQLIGYIILNNTRASFLALVLGILVGIFPVITTITNGYLLGFVARYSVDREGAFTLWKLLPHGVFELPAVIMSIGVGIYLGSLLIRKKKNIGKEFIDSLRFFVFIVIPLLIIAGVIEGLLIYFLR